MIQTSSVLPRNSKEIIKKKKQQKPKNNIKSTKINDFLGIAF